jgi:hypothetical protein
VRLSSDIILRLRQQYTAAARVAAEKALAGAPIADDLTRLKDYETLLALSRASERNNFIAAAAVGAACVLIAGLAWGLRIPSTKVHATVVADTVTFRPAGSWSWTGNWQLGDGPFRLDELSELTLPSELSSKPKLTERAWLDVEKGSVTLSELELGAGGTVTFFRSPPSVLQILSLNAPFRGQAQVSGTPVVSAGDANFRSAESETPRFEIPGFTSFYDAGRPGIPARIRFNAKDKITWWNIPVERLSFAREGSGGVGGPFFVSGIESGTITIGDTAEKVVLKGQDQLILESPSGVIRELELGPDSLRISFEGHAKKVSVGVTGFEENLVPTWLSYVYHQERLGFFWGAVVCLWGALWSTRQLLFK